MASIALTTSLAKQRLRTLEDDKIVFEYLYTQEELDDIEAEIFILKDYLNDPTNSNSRHNYR